MNHLRPIKEHLPRDRLLLRFYYTHHLYSIHGLGPRPGDFPEFPDFEQMVTVGSTRTSPVFAPVEPNIVANLRRAGAPLLSIGRSAFLR